MLSEFLSIIIRSLKLDKSLYRDGKNFGEAAIYFSIVIMLLVSIISIIPNSVFLEYLNESLNLGGISGPTLRSVIIGSLIFWLIKTVYLYFVGIVLFPNKSTNCNFRKVFVTVAYAHSPLIFNFLVFDKLFFILIFITYIWYNVTLIIGINQILNYKSVIKSTMLVLAPIIVLIIYTAQQFSNLNVGTIS
jgi:hypothetical protein